jgi:signal transduction histidine kinase
MQRLKNLWDKISGLGTESSQPHSLSGSIRLTNQAATIAMLLLIFYLLTELLFINYHLTRFQTLTLYSVQVGQIFLFILVLVLDFYKKNLAARILFCAVLPFAFLPNSYILNQPLRSEFYMYGFGASVFLFFSQRKFTDILYLVPIIVFLLMVFNLQQHYPAVYKLDFGTLIRISFSFLYLYLVMNLLRGENNRHATQLTDLNKLKNKIFSIVSHDLREPIGSLNAVLQMMENSQISQEEFQMLIKSLNGNVKQLHDTLDNLLLWTRAQSQGLKVMPQSFMLSLVVDDVFQLLKFRAESKGVLLQKQGNLEMNAFADQTMTRSILNNLISNAIKFTPKGGIVNVSVESMQNLVKVTVRDNGRGMPPEMVKSLFKTAQHFSTPGTDEEKGTGLGLLLCKEFVEKNGGTISVTSEQLKGSTFSFTIPSGKKSN